MNDLIDEFRATDAVAQLLAVKPQDSFHVVDVDDDGRVTGLRAGRRTCRCGSTAATSSCARGSSTTSTRARTSSWTRCVQAAEDGRMLRCPLRRLLGADGHPQGADPPRGPVPQRGRARGRCGATSRGTGARDRAAVEVPACPASRWDVGRQLRTVRDLPRTPRAGSTSCASARTPTTSRSAAAARCSTLAAAGRHGVTGVVLTGDGGRERRRPSGALPRFVPGAKVETLGPAGRPAARALGRGERRWRTSAERAATRPSCFAPRVDDAHQDHRLVGTLATTVWRDALVLHYEIPKWDGDLGAPDALRPAHRRAGAPQGRAAQRVLPAPAGRDWWDDELFLGLMRIRGVECRAPVRRGFFAAKVLLDLARRRTRR